MPPLVDPTSVLVALVLFLGGVLLLILSVEKLVERVVSAATAAGVPPLLLAVLVASVDPGNAGFGLAAVLGGSPGVAVGAAFGSAYFLLGAALPAAALVSPFEVRVSGRLLVPGAAAPAVLLPFLLDGRLAVWEGLALLALCAGGLFWMYRMEAAMGAGAAAALSGSGDPGDVAGEGGGEGADDGPRAGGDGGGRAGGGDTVPAREIGAAVLFLGGVVAGSVLAARGAGGLVSGLGLDGTALGATFVGLVLSLDEALLVLLPVRRGRPGVAAGTVVGELVFLATANVGVLALAGGLELATSVASLHGPALVAGSAVACLFLWQGRLGRARGAALLLLYLGVWGLSWASAASA